MTTKPVVYWDSCIFIDWIVRNKPERLPLITPLVDAAENDKIIIATSALALTEVARCNPQGSALSDAEERRIVDFFRNPFISVRLLDRPTAEDARRLIRQSIIDGIRLPNKDGIHLATALAVGACALHTFDAAHLMPHHRRHGNPPMDIFPPELPEMLKPKPDAQMTLEQMRNIQDRP